MLLERQKASHRPNAPRRPKWTRWSATRVVCFAVSLVTLLASLHAVAQDVGTESPGGTESSFALAPDRALAEESNPVEPRLRGGAAERVQVVGPDTFILLDEQGRPQPMPGMTYEDFMAAWKRLQHVEDTSRERRFTVEHVEMAGQALQRHVEIHCEITVRLSTEEPVDVPLGMAEAVLQDEPQFGPPAANATEVDDKVNANGQSRVDEYLEYEPRQGGFVARLIGQPGEKRTVSLTLLVPLVHDAAGATLALTCPRTLSSRLALDVPANIAEASVTSGVLTAQEPGAKGTRLIAAGAMGPFRLTWRTSDAAAEALGTVLNAKGAIRVALDGRSVRTSARLTVQSYGGSFDRFRVRLPRGAQLIQDRPSQERGGNSGYRVSLEQGLVDANQRTPGDGQQVVLVELPEKQHGPVTIDLTTEQPIGLEADSPVELAGMKVLGAVRQFGDVTLQVAPDWQARWDTGLHVRQVDISDIDPLLQQPEVTAAFQYDREPWTLAVRIAARRFRVLVSPEYTLDFTNDEARLTVHLTYQVLGARAFEFRVNLYGWELMTDPIESGGLVDDDRVLVMPDGVLVLPLAQSLSRRAEVTFSAKRALARDSRSIRLPLPVPLADSISPGNLVVRTAADIELIPKPANSNGLMLRPNAEPSGAVAGGGREFYFRTSQGEAVFAADRILRSREVSHEIFASITVEELDVQIKQRIEYEVRNATIQELSFEVPPELSLNKFQPEIALLSGGNGEESKEAPAEIPLGVIPSRQGDQAIEAAAVNDLHVVLPQPRLGKFSVLLRYRLPRPLETSPTSPWRLPFVRPTDGNFISQRANVQALRRLSVSLDSTAEDSTWRQTSLERAPTSKSSLEFAAIRPEVHLPLIARGVNANTPSATNVERVWLQTWVAGDRRQDRIAFRFRTAGSQVAVELAPQTPEVFELLMDRETARVLSREAGRVVVAVPQSAADTDNASDNQSVVHTLELRYRFPTGSSLVTRHFVTPHQMVGATALSQVYWHVVLPADKHLIGSPEQMVAASAWQWLGSFWDRRPTKSQADLEEWVGASTQIRPSGAQSEYLFTGLAPVATMDFVTAPRWLIVLAGSSCVLGLALGYMYVPAMRRRWMLGGLACLLAGLALSFPTAALLLAQASVLGVALATVSVLIARLSARPIPWAVVVPTSGTHRHLTPRPDSIVMPSLATAAHTPATVPLRVPDSE